MGSVEVNVNNFLYLVTVIFFVKLIINLKYRNNYGNEDVNINISVFL